jgi:tetratricopeptide (TPR) repeat protein
VNVRTLLVLVALAVIGLAAWPRFVETRAAQASTPTPAPVLADYLQRGRLVAFYEDAVRRHPDQIVTRLLAAQYLQRFRERGDVGDLSRAQRVAERSLAIQPRFNAGAELVLASSLTSMHSFRDGLVHAQRALRIEPANTAAVAHVASVLVELGRYDDANRVLRSVPAAREVDAGLYPALARYDELTGSVATARELIDLALAQTDSIIDSPAESRAWFHFHAGELAWTAGDGAAAERRFREALAILPDYPRALNGLARMYWGERRWRDALGAATPAAELVPSPEALGYKADAQRALGDAAGARSTDDLIAAIARIGNARALSDRALALYWSDHFQRPREAIAIARRDVAARDDVFAEDTLAWALARGGRWAEARSAARRAVRRNTQDARLQYHAGVIAMETGDRVEAARCLKLALALNPQFHPVDANDARKRLEKLAGEAS